MLHPENDGSDEWDEFRWERALREGDESAAKYFRLLKRFSDLPAADELIADRMGPDFDDDMPDCEADCESCPDRWNCEYAPPLDWEMFDDEEDDDDDEPGHERNRNAPPLTPGDALYFETHPAFRALRQVALGWCNVYAVILPAEFRQTGLKALFYIGRALANLSYSIGDGIYDAPARNIAFAKRALFAINTALGAMAEIMEAKPEVEKLIAAMRKHMLVAREAIVDHLHACRAKNNPQSDQPDA